MTRVWIRRDGTVYHSDPECQFDVGADGVADHLRQHSAVAPALLERLPNSVSACPVCVRNSAVVEPARTRAPVERTPSGPAVQLLQGLLDRADWLELSHVRQGYRIRGSAGWPYREDLVFMPPTTPRVAVEVETRGGGSEASQIRHRDLVAAGWSVVVLSVTDIADRFDDCVDLVERVLRQVRGTPEVFRLPVLVEPSASRAAEACPVAPAPRPGAALAVTGARKTHGNKAFAWIVRIYRDLTRSGPDGHEGGAPQV